MPLDTFSIEEQERMVPAWYVFVGTDKKVRRILELDLLGPFVYPGHLVKPEEWEAYVGELEAEHPTRYQDMGIGLKNNKK